MLGNAKYLVPNSVTALNMLFGFVAIHYAIEGNFDTAIWIVYLATFLDVLDGRLARALRATSKFGVEFDSFSDLVTFGIAPSILLYLAIFAELGSVGIVISFVPMLFSAIRLARFNVEAGQVNKRYMKGVPTPVSATFLVGYVAFADAIWGHYNYVVLAGFFTVSIGLLMVSNLKFESNSISRIRDLSESWKFIPFFLSIITVVIYGTPMLFIWGLFYVLMGLARWLAEHRPRRNEEARPA